MKVKMDAVLVGLDGENLKRLKKGGKKDNAEDLIDVTMRWVSTEALLGSYRDEVESGLDGEEKARRYELAKKVTVETEPDLSVEELAKIKKLVGKAFGADLVGPAYAALEGK
ncbi:MAG: hypothetical protein E6R04_08010 [Spirochaetes bacterium]|nr:MAG: hypothetical protein E6R04_08010 [Spirochaetota bacterium]